MEPRGTGRGRLLRGAGVAAFAVVLVAAPALPGQAATQPPPGAATAPPAPLPRARPAAPAPPAPPTAPTPPTASDRIAALALRVLHEMRSSRYAPRNVPTSTRTTGVFVTDCSGFVNFVVGRAAPASYRSLRTARATDRPTSWDYSLGLRRSVRSWSRVPHVADVRPGDVIAWTRPPDSRAGHVMVIASAAHPIGTRRWALDVIDSTSVPHGRADTRRHDHRNGPASTNGRPSGVGRGTIGLLVDATGRPVAYLWSAADHRVYHPSAITVSRATA